MSRHGRSHPAVWRQLFTLGGALAFGLAYTMQGAPGGIGVVEYSRGRDVLLGTVPAGGFRFSFDVVNRSTQALILSSVKCFEWWMRLLNSATSS